MLFAEVRTKQLPVSLLGPRVALNSCLSSRSPEAQDQPQEKFRTDAQGPEGGERQRPGQRAQDVVGPAQEERGAVGGRGRARERGPGGVAGEPEGAGGEGEAGHAAGQAEEEGKGEEEAEGEGEDEGGTHPEGQG